MEQLVLAHLSFSHKENYFVGMKARGLWRALKQLNKIDRSINYSIGDLVNFKSFGQLLEKGLRKILGKFFTTSIHFVPIYTMIRNS